MPRAIQMNLSNATVTNTSQPPQKLQQHTQSSNTYAQTRQQTHSEHARSHVGHSRVDPAEERKSGGRADVRDVRERKGDDDGGADHRGAVRGRRERVEHAAVRRGRLRGARTVLEGEGALRDERAPGALRGKWVSECTRRPGR